MKKLLFTIAIVFASQLQAKFTFSAHYEATRTMLKSYVAEGYSEDAALMLASATWIGCNGDETLCGTMLGIVIMEGGLTSPYDWKNYLSYAAMRPETAYAINSRAGSFTLENWHEGMQSNPAYATLLACKQLIRLRKGWKNLNNAVRVWLAGPIFKTDPKENARSLKYLNGVIEFRQLYIAEVSKEMN